MHDNLAGAVLILGAASDVARAAASAFAARGHALYLAEREPESLDRLAQDLRAQFGVEVHSGAFDPQDYAAHRSFFATVTDTFETLDGVFLAFAYPGDQDAAVKRVDEAVTIISRNFTGAVSILTHVANHFEERNHGFIIALTSTAGDRGRRSSYVFGASKAGLTTFLEGLRSRLHGRGVRVITVKPAAEDAAAGLGVDPELAASFQATPEEIGHRVVEALDHSADVLYVPWFWRPVMSAVKLIPEMVFKRLPF